MPAWPPILYGTAWKEDDTERLTAQALAAGFRGIDTANQRKHYLEEGVGRAIAGWPRDALFLQTKFTFRPGQDDRLPYDPAAPIGEQVAQSFASSIAHLGTDHVDSYVLHGPSTRPGLGGADRAAWAAMEALHDAGHTRHLGVSNVSADQVRELVGFARIKPTFVQNRCYASRGWDADVRAVCAEHGLVYQGFSLLTANPQVVTGPASRIGAARGLTGAQIVFALSVRLGMLPLTGTRSPVHLAQDLAALDVPLTDAEVAALGA